MKILLDEMYTGLKEYFEIMGWDVKTVQEAGLSGSTDREVVEFAKEKEYLIVTQDQKPAELADLQDVPNVLISQKAIAELIDSKIKQNYPQA